MPTRVHASPEDGDGALRSIAEEIVPMRAQETKGVLIRLPLVEHALLMSILKESGSTLQHFFRQAARRQIHQRAQAVAALEGEAGEDA